MSERAGSGGVQPVAPAAAPKSLQPSARGRGPDAVSHWPQHVVLILMVLINLYPLAWVVSIALSGEQALSLAEVPADPTVMDRLRAIIPWPERISLANFTDVFQQQPFGRWLLNSVVVAGMTTLLGVFLACTAGYAFSRFRFPGRRAGLMSFLVSQMFPGTLTLIPLFIIVVKWLGLGSTFTGLVLVYSTISIPCCVWMLKGYFDTIPKELEESALMDGASVGRIFWSIILPLAKPAIAITALFSFMTGWNEFILAATFMDREAMYTAPVGLRFFVGGFQQQWGYFAAGAIIAAVPVVIIRSVAQRRVVDIRTVLGAICVYVLLGMMWVFAYAAIGDFSTDAFFAQLSASETTTADYLCFSYVRGLWIKIMVLLKKPVGMIIDGGVWDLLETAKHFCGIFCL